MRQLTTEAPEKWGVSAAHGARLTRRGSQTMEQGAKPDQTKYVQS